VFLAGFLDTTYGIELGFGRWMLIGLPLVVVFLPLTWFVLTRVLYRLPRVGDARGHALLESEYEQLGPMSGGEKRVLVVFAATVVLWISREPLQSWDALLRWLPGIRHLTDAGVALTAALVLFLLPVGWRRDEAVLDWKTAERLPWGVLLLFGGGLSLAAAFQESGLARWISQLADHMHGLPLELVVLVVVSGIVFLTELTSNTATAATFLPVLAGVAEGLQRDPLLLVVPAALAASCAFMMPVATPPNAIVFSSGHVGMRHMVRAGLILNAFSIALLMLLTFGLVVRILHA
jgi:sodium-dependent dicarboxylate transporter 2/3/5